MAYASISKPSLHFNTKLYTGTDANLSITGVNFQPDLTWIKSRSATGAHQLMDAVRGAAKRLSSNSSGVEDAANGLLSFDTDGFSMGDSSTSHNMNGSGVTYASWNWKANGQGSSNTDGSINTTYTSANTTSGFSIVKYTGTEANATIGHGLSAAPKVIIIKGLSTTHDWVYGGDNIGWTKYLNLNNNSVGGTASAVWNDTAPTSSVFSVGNNQAVNQSGVEHIAYCFAEKKGYSKFGSYTGNGNADGTFVYTGFKPAFVILKRTDATNNWHMGDNKRLNPYNPLSTQLYPNLNNSETENADLDFLSNGFKLRVSSTFGNASGGSYIYMAFAAEPLVANVGQSIPATAR